MLCTMCIVQCNVHYDLCVTSVNLMLTKFSARKMTTVAVIGAGISGLAAAYYLSKASHLKVNSAFEFHMLACCYVNFSQKNPADCVPYSVVCNGMVKVEFSSYLQFYIFIHPITLTQWRQFKFILRGRNFPQREGDGRSFNSAESGCGVLGEGAASPLPTSYGVWERCKLPQRGPERSP